MTPFGGFMYETVMGRSREIKSYDQSTAVVGSLSTSGKVMASYGISILCLGAESSGVGTSRNAPNSAHSGWGAWVDTNLTYASYTLTTSTDDFDLT